MIKGILLHHLPKFSSLDVSICTSSMSPCRSVSAGSHNVVVYKYRSVKSDQKVRIPPYFSFRIIYKSYTAQKVLIIITVAIWFKIKLRYLSIGKYFKLDLLTSTWDATVDKDKKWQPLKHIWRRL